MNKVELMGRLTADVELKESAKENSKKYAKFSLAVPRKLDKEKTDFINCVAFGRIADTIAKYCKKGMKIIVCGSLQIDSYTTKDGASAKSTTVIVDDFYFTEFNKKVNEDNSDNETVF